MASNGSNRSGLLTAGGVLSIIGGALEVIGALLIGVLTVGVRILAGLAPIPFRPGDWWGHVIPSIPFWFIIVGVPLLALGIVAIVGGVSALRRRSFGLSGWRLGPKEEKLWPIPGRGYLCPPITHSRDTGNNLHLPVKERI